VLCRKKGDKFEKKLSVYRITKDSVSKIASANLEKRGSPRYLATSPNSKIGAILFERNEVRGRMQFVQLFTLEDGQFGTEFFDYKPQKGRPANFFFSPDSSTFTMLGTADKDLVVDCRNIKCGTHIVFDAPVDTFKARLNWLALLGNDRKNYLMSYEANKLPALYNKEKATFTSLASDQATEEIIVPDPRSVFMLEASRYEGITRPSYSYDWNNKVHSNCRIVVHNKLPLAYILSKKTLDIWNIDERKKVKSIEFDTQNNLKNIVSDEKNSVFLVQDTSNKTWVVKQKRLWEKDIGEN
jgi:hypothetical protein